MPIFAYRCRSCGAEFQTLVMSGETPDAGAGADPDFGSCSTGMCCGGGACGAFADA